MENYSDIITSKDNPGIRLIKKLMTSKKERIKRQQFVLEGARIVHDALKSGADIKKIYAAKGALEKYGERLSGSEYTVISDNLSAAISDTLNTQGVFAVCSMLSAGGELPVLKKGGRYAVLSQLQDPGNAGMIIRTADALGLDGVIFSESCDIYNPKTVRATMGSIFRIPVYHEVSSDILFERLKEAEIPSYAAVVDDNAASVSDMTFDKGGAVFIGNEGNGLSEEIQGMCSKSITIKMTGNTESLNAAMAAGIIMWELMK